MVKISKFSKSKPDPESESDETETTNSENEESVSESEEENNKKKFDRAKFKKFLSKTFPSKYMKKEVEKEEAKVPCKRSKNAKANKKNKNYKSSDEESNSEENEVFSESEESNVSESDEKQETIKNKKGNNQFNIILQIGGKKKNYENNDDDDDEEDSYWEDISESDEDINGIDTEDEDEPVSSDDEETDDSESNKSEEEEDDSHERKKMNIEMIDQKIEEQQNLLKKLQTDHDQNSSVKKFIKECEKNIERYEKKKEKKQSKHKEKNSRIFRKIIRDKNAMNDIDFFKKLDMENQKKVIKELREINKHTRIEKPYRMSLLEAPIPVQFKAAAMKKINLLRSMDPGSGEYYKIKNWVDTFMRMPFGKYESLSVCLEDGVDNCHDFMEKAQKTLDQAVYGLNDAKMQIMQMLGQLITNPKALGTAIAIHGPPGTGKTSLVKEGISKILNRPFAFIALGGATDSSFLEGHSYTYEGSSWGKIVQILIDSKCMNPVIYFDELDKISETPKGEEITGILTHLTDTSQNTQFHDKYFSEIDFDLSKCLFIFSYNDESKVNPILKDRMYRIQTKGYNLKQKTVITNQYLLPRLREQVKFTNGEVIIPDETIHYMIDAFCNKEDGVRNLKRCLEIIHTKLNLYRLMKPGSNLFEEDLSLKVQFPFTVTKAIVDKLIKKDKDNNSVLYSLYV
jgi:ATP-dependent Lon protease